MQYTTFKSTLLTYFLAQTSVTDLIERSVYFGNYYTLVGMPYPSVVFQMDDGSSYLNIVKSFPMTVYAFSEIHFDEAHQVMDVVAGLLESAIIGGAIVFSVTGNPTENYVAAPRLYEVSLPVHVTLL